MRAYIYARFSTLEQAKGSSLARQLDDCRSLCDRRGWDRAADRELVDEGRSAYHGANRAEGSCLASFERDALSGLLPADTVLVVERLDRLSRQSPVEVFNLVSRLTESGVTVATVDGDHIYQRGSYDFTSLIQLIVKAQVSHEESEKKSQRLSAAWARKRARAADGDKRPFTRRCPEWIAVDDQTGRYVLRPERAAVVRRIFQMATSGHGKHLIARTLNLEEVPTWGRGNGWHASYIHKILASRAVVGEMQPHRTIGGTRVPEGDPIRDYFPAAVDEATFVRAQVDRVSRSGFGGRRGRRISNLFAGLARCGACGGAMTFRNKGKPGEQYLVCDAASRGRSCSQTMHFNYPALESAIIDQTLHMAVADRHLGPSDRASEAEVRVAEKRRALADLEARQRRLIDLLSRQENEQVERQLHELAEETVSTKRDLETGERELAQARGALTPKENIARIRALLAALSSEDDYVCTAARGTVQQALRSLVKSIICDPDTARVIVDVGVRHFTLDRGGVLQSAGNEIGLERLMQLREKGWVLAKYENDPVLRSSGTPLRESRPTDVQTRNVRVRSRRRASSGLPRESE